MPQTRASFISNRSGIITYLCLYSLLFADFLYQERSRKEKLETHFIRGSHLLQNFMTRVSFLILFKNYLNNFTLYTCIWNYIMSIINYNNLLYYTCLVKRTCTYLNFGIIKRFEIEKKALQNVRISKIS